ncbi:hypothetical protein [Streptomyces sp. NPDC018038]|uniref:hypothetical protein n=1 Tax=Streptomyces sp. NPDC018038 TaxID=3365036 RepID=UPI0037BA430B
MLFTTGCEDAGTHLRGKRRLVWQLEDRPNPGVHRKEPKHASPDGRARQCAISPPLPCHPLKSEVAVLRRRLVVFRSPFSFGLRRGGALGSRIGVPPSFLLGEFVVDSIAFCL